MAHAHALVPKRQVLIVCCTCAPVIVGLAADMDPGCVVLDLPATLTAGTTPAPCMACGTDMRGDDLDTTGQLPN